MQTKKLYYGLFFQMLFLSFVPGVLHGEPIENGNLTYFPEEKIALGIDSAA